MEVSEVGGEEQSRIVTDVLKVLQQVGDSLTLTIGENWLV
jgi:hypothetical protein